MAIRGIFYLFLLGVSGAAAQEMQRPLPNVEAALVMDKEKFLVGEPVMVTLIVRNMAASGDAGLADSDAYGRCSPYSVEVVPEAPSHEPRNGPSCASFHRIESIDCLFGGLNVQAGQETRQRILLNHFHDFLKSGTYEVKVRRHLSYFKSVGKENQRAGEISATFLFSVVEPSSPDELKAAFAPYIEALSSDDYEKKQEAGIVISALATPFLEPHLLKMLSERGLRFEAAHGLQRINTANARRALFDLLAKEDSLSFDALVALQSLREMGDASYGPRLLGLPR